MIRLERSFLSFFNSENVSGVHGWRLAELRNDGLVDLKGFDQWRREAENLLNLARRFKVFFAPDDTAERDRPPLARVYIIGSGGDVDAELELIELAMRENPHAFFFYQKPAAAISSRVSEALARLKQCDFLEPGQLPPEIDRVYTVDSLLAVGYIWAGLKVTVTGRPFYAGRGLTDDHGQRPRPQPLSEVELFYYLCLGATGYEAAPDDPVRGCLAAILALGAGQCQRRLDVMKKNRRKTDWLIYSRLPAIMKKWKLARQGLERTLGSLCPGLKAGASPEDDLGAAALIGRIGALGSAAKTGPVPARILPGELAGRYEPLKLKQPARLLELTKICFERRSLARFFSLGRSLLLGGQVSPTVLWLLIEGLRLRFFHKEALALSLLAGGWFPGWRKGLFFWAASQDALLVDRPEDALRLLAYCFIKHKRPAELPFPGPEKKLNELYGRLPWQKALTSVQLASPGRWNLGRVKSLLYAGDAPACLERIEKRLGHGRLDYSLLKAQLLRLTGEYRPARRLLEEALTSAPEGRQSQIYQEALTLSLNFDDDWRFRLWADIEKKGVKVSEFLAWQTLCGLGRLKEAFKRHSRAPYFNQLRAYLGKRFSPEPFKGQARRILVLSECFLGDEIRFSRLYPALAQALPAERVIFACDPRLKSLLSRSFPELYFHPVQKKFSLHAVENLAAFNRLPGSDCVRYLDNEGWQLALESDKVTTVMHALAGYLNDYSDLDHLPDLKADPSKTRYFKDVVRERSPGAGLIAGLSWRSSLSRHDRDQSFFTLPQLAPLLAMDDVQWVNCQYDGLTDRERDYLNRHFPERLLNLDQVDQYNNVDDTAALYRALDIMISGPTFSADLAGGLGCETLLFSRNSSLMAWACPGTDRHAFMRRVELCGLYSDGQAADLVQHLKQRLERLKQAAGS